MNTKYWQTEKALEYLKITRDILHSDLPAYAAMFALANVQGKRVLEVGSFLGDRARELKHWAKEVVGIDINPQFVQSAKERYGNVEGLSFYEVNNGDEYPLTPNGQKYHAVLVPFVHPVIQDAEIVEALIQKSYRVLEEGGKIILLGLHPNAFNPKNHFVSYRLKLGESGYVDGAPFENILVTNTGDEVLLEDYARTEKTLASYMANAGFKNIAAIDLKDNLPGIVGDVLRRSSSALKLNRGVELIDELKSPLHQLYYGEK